MLKQHDMLRFSTTCYHLLRTIDASVAKSYLTTFHGIVTLGWCSIAVHTLFYYRHTQQVTSLLHALQWTIVLEGAHHHFLGIANSMSLATYSQGNYSLPFLKSSSTRSRNAFLSLARHWSHRPVFNFLSIHHLLVHRIHSLLNNASCGIATVSWRLYDTACKRYDSWTRYDKPLAYLMIQPEGRSL